MVIHRTLREGDPTFREELINYGRNRGHILNISNFKDDSSPNGTCSIQQFPYLIRGLIVHTCVCISGTAVWNLPWQSYNVYIYASGNLALWPDMESKFHALILCSCWNVAWDYSTWIRTYALFLEERLECFRVLKYDVESERATVSHVHVLELGQCYTLWAY
jgi:hypothetical protein